MTPNRRRPVVGQPLFFQRSQMAFRPGEDVLAGSTYEPRPMSS